MVHILMGRKFFHDFYQFRKAYLLLVDFLTGMKKKTYIKLKASYQIPRHMVVCSVKPHLVQQWHLEPLRGKVCYNPLSFSKVHLASLHRLK